MALLALALALAPLALMCGVRETANLALACHRI